LGGGEGVLIQPSLVNSAKPTISEQSVGTEITCGRFQLLKTEHVQFRPFQNFATGERKRRRRAFPADAFSHEKLTLSDRDHGVCGGYGELHVAAVNV